MWSLSHHESHANAGKDFIPLLTQLVEEVQFQIRTLGFILFSVSPSESDTLMNQLWSGSSVLFKKVDTFWVILFWEPDYIWQIYFYPKIELREQQAEYVYPAAPPPRVLKHTAVLPEPYSMCTSARRTTRLPSGQMTWSTWERTRSHVSSGVRRLVWKEESAVDWL